jgi:hypothetical protein
MQIRNLFWLAWLILGANPAIGQHSIPDTAVNKLKLGDYKNTERIFGPVWDKKSFEADGLLPRLEIVNRDNTQVLRLMVDYGGTKDAANQFEILAVNKHYKFPRKLLRMNIDSFTTSRKITLFLKKESVIKILGKGYKVLSGKGGDEEVFFESSESDDFVKRYNEYKYFIQCSFRNGVLVKYWFGFESV